MNREEYLSYRRSGNTLMIMYKHYVKCFDEKKHSKLLDVNEFSQYMQMWAQFIFIPNTLMSLYDNYFSIVLLLNKDGQLINII